MINKKVRLVIVFGWWRWIRHKNDECTELFLWAIKPQSIVAQEKLAFSNDACHVAQLKGPRFINFCPLISKEKSK